MRYMTRFAFMMGLATLFSGMRWEGNTVWTWGSDGHGQLGRGPTTTIAKDPVPAPVLGFKDVIAVTSGGSSTFALKNDGTVWAWGMNYSGELGVGKTELYTTLPLKVSGLSGVAAIMAKGGHSVALLKNGTVWTWGSNKTGELGDGTTQDRSKPVKVVNLSMVKAVAAGGGFTLALRSDGMVWGWGSNDAGRLTLGKNVTHSTVPVKIQGLSDITAIASGTGQALALKKNGTVWGWGKNSEGQVGNGAGGDGVAYCDKPIQVKNLSGVTAIAAGNAHSLALKGGLVWGWGFNIYGQATGTRSGYIHVKAPVLVANLSGVTAVACGEFHSLARKGDGTVYSWGSNSHGQLGQPLAKIDSLTAEKIPNLSGVIFIAGGGNYSIAGIK